MIFTAHLGTTSRGQVTENHIHMYAPLTKLLLFETVKVMLCLLQNFVPLTCQNDHSCSLKFVCLGQY